ncbi:MAG: hypothetical protein V2A53_03375, partial [bacterium]
LQNGFFSEDVAGDYLFILGKGYFGQVGIMDEIGSSYIHLPFFKDICSANLFVEADVNYIFGMPYTMSIRGLSIDADRNICAVIGDQGKIKEFMTISGYTSSVLEHAIWEKWYGEGAVSAIKAIQIAIEIGIPVYDIDSSNVNIVDGFNITSLAKQNIKNAINAGNIAKCPQSSISYNGWQGVGYIISDPTTGEGRYEIADVSGGLFLATHPSAKSFSYYDKIEKDAIIFARNLSGGCSDFASFAQFLANKFTDQEFRDSFFLSALYDLSVSDEFAEDNLWFFGLLGNMGPRRLRPKWLNTHDDASGFKLIVPCDCGAENGRKDHFVTNATNPALCDIIELFMRVDVSWLPYEDCLNDLEYNELGRLFGTQIPIGGIPKSDVGSWIKEHLQ